MRLAGVAALLVASVALGQGYAPEEAAGKMTLPEGFRAVLFASEPVIRQPVCIEFDDRGRLWCVQYLQYPKPAGLKPVKVDRWSRAKYDQVPPPPPKGPKGADVITILEDVDGDGRADTHKNFLEGLNLCSSIAFGHGGVFVLQVPYLLFYPDKDRDDVPDGDPEVLLTGFGMEDAHSVANSLTWGPDGWLYGTQGSTVTSNIRGIEFQQGVWRYHVEDKRFELFCEGGGNMWGLDFNEVGDCFASTNWGPYVMLHAEQGAYYVKAFGKHGSLHNPYAYGYFEHATHHNAQGGHVANGGLVYQGGAYPAEFNGKYIVNNLLSHAVYFHDIIPVGSTYETRHAGTLLDSNDASFAPSDLTTGPDGCLYVADWNDKRTAHPDPEAEWNTETGRIYKIVYGAPKQVEKFDLREESNADLVKRLDNANYWFRRRAQVLLSERTDITPQLLLNNPGAGEEISHLDRVWAAISKLDSTDPMLTRLILDPNAAIRKAAIQKAGDESKLTRENADQLVLLASQEANPRVRSQLAATARRIHDLTTLDKLLLTMVRRDSDAADAHIPLMLWWAVEAHSMTLPPSILGCLGDFSTGGSIGTNVIRPRLFRRYATAGNIEGDQALSLLLLFAIAPSQADFEGVEQGLQDRGQPLPGVTQGSLFESSAQTSRHAELTSTGMTRVSDGVADKINHLYKERPDELVRLCLAVHIGNAEAYDAAKKRAIEGPNRVEVLEILARYGKEDCVDILFAALMDKHAPVREAGLDALKHFSDDATGTRLLDVYGSADASLQPKLRAALLGKPNWARAFLAAVDGGKIAADTVKAEELRVVAAHNDEKMAMIVEKHWGRISAGTPEEKLAEMRRLNNELNFAKGDAAKGKAIFAETCLKCHTLFGEGGKVGPDLTQANRGDREFLLTSLVDPSAMVRKEYQQFTVTTKALEVLTGLMMEGKDGAITLYDANAQPTALQRGAIDSMEESPLSLMPEDLLKAMNGDAVRDLFAYLQSAVDKH